MSASALPGRIVLLRWSRRRDTLTRPESPFNLDCPRHAITVCNRASARASLVRIAARYTRRVASGVPSTDRSARRVPARPAHDRRFLRPAR